MKTKLTVLVLAIFLWCSGWSVAGGAPRCSDPAVKQIVTEWIKNEMKTELLNEMNGDFENPFGKGYLNTPLSDGNLFLLVGNPTIHHYRRILGNRTYSQKQEMYRKKRYPNSEEFKEKCKNIDRRIDPIVINFSSIRTGSGISFGYCAAEISMGDEEPKTILYSVQYTDDGDIYLQYMEVM